MYTNVYHWDQRGVLTSEVDCIPLEPHTAQKVTVCKSFQSWILHSFQVVHKLGNELKCPSVESLMNGGEQACTPLGHFVSFPSLYTTWKL